MAKLFLAGLFQRGFLLTEIGSLPLGLPLFIQVAFIRHCGQAVTREIELPLARSNRAPWCLRDCLLLEGLIVRADDAFYRGDVVEHRPLSFSSLQTCVLASDRALQPVSGRSKVA